MSRLLFSCTLYISLLLISTSACSEQSTADSYSTLQTEQFTLDNGMQAIAIPNHKVSAVSHMIWYKVGQIDEAQGKSGIAHFLEHLMFKGTQRFPDGSFSQNVARNGGNDNAFTGKDYTAYYQNIARDKLELVMDMESDRMRNLTLNEKEVLTERKVILEERSARTDNIPRNQLMEKLRLTLFGQTPYGKPVIGWKDEIAALTRADALEFYNTYYAPNNAILVVAGDITGDELKALAEKYYGSIPKNDAIPERPHLSYPAYTGPQTIRHYDVTVKTPELIRWYLAPNQLFGETKHAYGLELLSQILGGGETSRLYQKLVVEDEVAVSISTSYSDISLGPSIFSIHAIPQKGITLEELEQKISATITDLLEDGTSKGELQRAKTLLTASAIYARDGFKTLGYIFGTALVSGLSADYIQHWPSHINDTTAEQVLDAAQHVFQDRRAISGWLQPQNAKDKESKR